MAKKTFQTNEKIRIELISGKKFESVFRGETSDGIEVVNSKDLRTGKVFRIIQTFYNAEIRSVQSIAQSENNNSNGNGANIEIQNADRQSAGANKQITKKSFTGFEVQSLQNNATKNAVYIAQFDDNYHNAINDLKRQRIIAVHSENKSGRLDPKLPLIAVATCQRVYLFDILRLGMKKELKQIFSADVPRKIVHSSAQLADYLHHTESCSLKNAFDTLMVHFALSKTRTPISFQDCMQTYFELPDDFVLQKFNYGVRPLEKEALVRSALNALLLDELYWFFNDILMKPLYTATQQFSEICINVEHPVDLMTNLNYERFPGVEDININAEHDLEETFGYLNTN